MMVGRSEVVGHPVSIGRPVPGRFWARDEQLVFMEEEGGEVKSEQFCGWKLSDLGIQQALRGSNSGVRAKISTCPACLLAILLGLACRAQRDTKTQRFILVRATVVV